MIEANEYFHVQPDYVELHPNEEVETEWTFNAKLDVPHETKIMCNMRVISNNDELIGLPFEVYVTLNAVCEYAQICVS